MRAGAALAVAVALGGCETATSVFGLNSEAAPQEAVQQRPTQTASITQPARIAIAPVMGAPEAVAQPLAAKLAEQLERQKVTVAKTKDAKTEYVVRAYLVAAKDAAGTRISYIYDLTDQTGTKRAHRIQGEEVIKGTPAQDPWSLVNPTALQGISERAAAKIAGWLPPTQSVPVATAPTTPPIPSPNRAPTPVSTAPEKTLAATTATQTTASIATPTPVSALVPTVVGAPGDGPTALVAALKRELKNNSVALADKGGPNVYKVQGVVTIGTPVDGKQSVEIVWEITAPNGRKLREVIQKNTVQQGSLDGKWGQTADLAASAAAVEITKLLAQDKAAVN